MRVIPLDRGEAVALAERLATYDSLRDIPFAEREWLVANGAVRRYDAGEKVVEAPNEAQEFVVVLSGRIVVYFGHGGGRRHAQESRAGSLTGVLPYSRLRRAQWDVLAEEDVELLAVHRDSFPEMVRECPVLTESLVHTMVDRARRFAAANWEDEKVMSLGRLAAGLAHELNNPASAAASGAKRLAQALEQVGDSAQQLGAAQLTDEQRTEIRKIVDRCRKREHVASMSALERADASERVSEWLSGRGLDTGDADTLLDGGVDVATLDRLSTLVTGAPLEAVVRWVAAVSAAAVVASDVERATRRINDLVTAVRAYTYMDRAPVREPTDLARGIADTVEVMRGVASAKGRTIRIDVTAQLPQVMAVGPDLNQAWANLLQNALDASPPGGEVVVKASIENGSVIVSFLDGGAGIPAELQGRVFDPFFTTKPAGAGVGLGLDIVRRIARNHDGDVDFETRPGHTEFRVRLPLASS